MSVRKNANPLSCLENVINSECLAGGDLWLDVSLSEAMHARIQKVLSLGVQLWRFWFFSWWGREDQINTKGVPSSARQRNAIEMAFCWRADGGPTLNASLVFQGIQTSIAKKPYIFVIFQGGGVRTPCPPHWICPCNVWMDQHTRFWYLSHMLKSL